MFPPSPPQIESPGDHRQVLGIRLALVALVIAVYWPALGFGYVRYDDPEYVTNNSVVQGGLSATGVQWALTARYAANWHPLTWLSLMLDTSIFGNDAWGAFGHHLVNIILHALNALLLLGVLRRMTSMLWRSALVAALFAVHPMHVESVAWVSERKDVLSMLFWLLAMRAYADYVRDIRVGRYLMVVLWMALGLMAKPMLVTLPAVLLLLDFWPLRRIAGAMWSGAWWRRCTLLLLEKLPLLLLSSASAAVTIWVQRGGAPLQEGHWLALPQRLQNVSIAYVMYLGKLLWPAKLACLYLNPLHLGDFVWPQWRVLAAGALLIVITSAAVILARRAPYLLMGWLWYVIAMTPVIGLVEVGRQLIADRYAYIPFVGLYIALVWLAVEVVAHWRAGASAPWRFGAALAGVAVVALAFVAHRQVWVWRDSLTLFSHAVQVTDRNWLMLNNLAGVLEENEHRPDEALKVMRQAVEICDCSWVQEHYGEMLSRAGHAFEAQQALERAVALNPSNALAQNNLGIVLLQRGQSAAALEHLRQAVDLQPDKAEYHKSLAMALALDGRHDEAVTHMQEAIRLQSDPETKSQWQILLGVIQAGNAPAAGDTLRP